MKELPQEIQDKVYKPRKNESYDVEIEIPGKDQGFGPRTITNRINKTVNIDTSDLSEE